MCDLFDIFIILHEYLLLSRRCVFHLYRKYRSDVLNATTVSKAGLFFLATWWHAVPGPGYPKHLNSSWRTVLKII